MNPTGFYTIRVGDESLYVAEDRASGGCAFLMTYFPNAVMFTSKEKAQEFIDRWCAYDKRGTYQLRVCDWRVVAVYLSPSVNTRG